MSQQTEPQCAILDWTREKSKVKVEKEKDTPLALEFSHKSSGMAVVLKCHNKKGVSK